MGKVTQELKTLYGDEHSTFFVNHNVSSKCAKHLDSTYSEASKSICIEIYSEIKKADRAYCFPDNLDRSVSFDGRWLTQGHTSLIGVGRVTNILIGYAIDFDVMDKVCHHCSVAKNKLGEMSAEFHV